MIARRQALPDAVPTGADQQVGCHQAVPAQLEGEVVAGTFGGPVPLRELEGQGA